MTVRAIVGFPRNTDVVTLMWTDTDGRARGATFDRSTVRLLRWTPKTAHACQRHLWRIPDDTERAA